MKLASRIDLLVGVILLPLLVPCWIVGYLVGHLFGAVHKGFWVAQNVDYH